jgi:hypothetical protein
VCEGRRSLARANPAPAPSWFAAAVILSLTGCSSTICALRLARASDEVARAEQLDAARRAPYEYHYALEYLRKARSEAQHAELGDAVLLAEVAHEYASRALRVAQRVEPLVPNTPRGHDEVSPQ